MVLGSAFCRYLQCVKSVTYHTEIHQHIPKILVGIPCGQYRCQQQFMLLDQTELMRTDSAGKIFGMWVLSRNPRPSSNPPDNDPKICREEALDLLSAAKSEIGWGQLLQNFTDDHAVSRKWLDCFYSDDFFRCLHIYRISSYCWRPCCGCVF